MKKNQSKTKKSFQKNLKAKSKKKTHPSNAVMDDNLESSDAPRTPVAFTRKGLLYFFGVLLVLDIVLYFVFKHVFNSCYGIFCLF